MPTAERPASPATLNCSTEGRTHESHPLTYASSETTPPLRHPGLPEVRNRQAVAQKFAYNAFLALRVEDEIARRKQRKLVMRQRRAGINTQKTLESYDFTFNLGVN